MNLRCARTIILQSCDASYTPLLDATAATNQAYARKHGYAFRQFVGNLSSIPHTANFNRYYLLREEISRGEHDWALWLDADAIVVNHANRLETIIERSPDRLLIACRGTFDGEFDINNGVFLLNLRHRLSGEIVDAMIGHCERLDPRVDVS